jgi:hypothetical protein
MKTLHLHRGRFAAAWLVLAAVTPATHADPILYATAGAGTSLVRINVARQQVTTLGDFGVPGGDAIAISAQGQAFTVTHGWLPGGDSQLARVNLKTGVDFLHGLAIRPASPTGPVLYASGELGTQLVRIDVGAAT